MRGDKSWRRQAFMHSKQKIPDSWRTGWKAKACTVMLCSVFEGIQEPFTLSLACKSVVSRSIKPCLHTQLPEHKKTTEKFLGVGGIWSPGMDPWWGVWTAFRPGEGGIWTKIFHKFKCPGGCPGGDVEASIWLVHYQSESNQGLMLETSASESLYSGQFTLSTQLIKPNDLDCKEFGTPK